MGGGLYGGVEGWRGGLAWNHDLGKGRGVEISLIIKLIIKKYIIFIINMQNIRLYRPIGGME